MTDSFLICHHSQPDPGLIEAASDELIFLRNILDYGKEICCALVLNTVLDPVIPSENKIIGKLGKREREQVLHCCSSVQTGFLPQS